jgi:fluoride exporter
MGQSRIISWMAQATRWLLQVARNKMVLLILGGAIGTLMRYWISRWFGSQPWTRGLPVGTFFINVSGSFILGAAGVVILEHLAPDHQDLFLLIGTGFCGGFTTFSTFEWETFRLIRDGNWSIALANVLASVILGLIGVMLGVTLMTALLPRR